MQVVPLQEAVVGKVVVGTVLPEPLPPPPPPPPPPHAAKMVVRDKIVNNDVRIAFSFHQQFRISYTICGGCVNPKKAAVFLVIRGYDV